MSHSIRSTAHTPDDNGVGLSSSARKGDGTS